MAAFVAGLLLTVGTGSPVGAQDPVQDARRDADVAQARLDEILRQRRELQARLDRAVVNFEGRRGQLGRLDQAEDLAEGELARVRVRARSTVRARDDFVRSLYKRPAPLLFSWAMGEREIGDAIHRGLMVGYVLDAGASSLRVARQLEEALLERTSEVDDLGVQARQALVELAEAQEELNGLLVEIAALERSARQLAATTAARADELEALASQGGSGALRCPVGVPNSFVDTWGAPRSGGRLHRGVDIFAPDGTDLFAVADGVVDRTGTLSLGGITLHLDTDGGDRFYYAHLSAYAAGIGPGARVR
ncbi:MAG TPA: peptidoglycan DD-metalloendopeptidase family protein, partial [Nitriliruptorales bacterium]